MAWYNDWWENVSDTGLEEAGAHVVGGTLSGGVHVIGDAVSGGQFSDSLVDNVGNAIAGDPFGEAAAAEAARRHQERLAEGGMNLITQGSQGALSELANSQAGASDALAGGFGNAQDFLQAGGASSLEALLGGNEDALGTLLGAQGQASGALGQGFGQARGDLSGLAGLLGHSDQFAQGFGAADAMSGRGRRGDAMLDRAGGLFGGFEQDPGYQFRQQQGEQAINRANSARGGRASGRAMKELSSFNQGLASQEYGNFANRRAQEFGASQQSDATLNALLGNQAGRTDAANAARQNALGQLVSMGGGAQTGMANLAAQQGQAQSGLDALFGQQVSNLYSQGGQQQADLLTNLGNSLAGNQTQYGTSLAGLISGTGSQRADVLNQQGQSLANILTGHSATGGDGAAMQAGANSQKDLLGMIMSMWSDARLKDDIETIPSKYETIGLRGVRWVWNKIANRLGLSGAAEGVIAQEVAGLYPHAVGTRQGYMVVNYGELDMLIDGAGK